VTEKSLYSRNKHWVYSITHTAVFPYQRTLRPRSINYQLWVRMIVDDEIIWSSQFDNDPVPHATLPTTLEFDGDSRAAVVWGCDIRTCIVFSTRAFIKQKRRSRTRWFLLIDSGEEIIQLPRGGNWGGIFNYTPTTPNMRWWLGALFPVQFFLWSLRKLNPCTNHFPFYYLLIQVFSNIWV